MKSIIRHMCIIMTVLLLGTAVHAELQLFENWEGKTTVDNQPANGVLGGFVDTDSDGTGNVALATGIAGNATTALRVDSHSSGDERGAMVSGVNNPIEDGEVGLLFFRFRHDTHSRRAYTRLGMTPRNMTTASSDGLGEGDENDSYWMMSAGFLCYRDSTSGPISIRTIAQDNVGTELTTITAGLWYDCWIVADNGADTFDLYIQPSTTPGGPPPTEGPTSDPLLDDAPFHYAPDLGGLYGWVCMLPDDEGPHPRPWADRGVQVYSDDIYWDGDQGLSSMTAQKPIPAKGAVNVPPYQVLSWEAPDDPAIAEVIGYDIFVDPNEPKIMAGDPSTLKSSVQPGTSFDPTPDLAFAKTFYWRVDSWVTLAADPNTPKEQVLQPGKVWLFTTKSPAPEITAQPANVLVSVGQPASFTVAVLSPHAPVSYQWYTSADSVNNTVADDVLIDGATSDTYTIPSVALANETYYYCKTSNVYNSIPYTTFSNTAALGVKRQVAYWNLDALGDGKYPDSSGEGHHAQPGGTPVFADGVNPTLTGNGVVVDSTNGWAEAGTWNPSQYSGQLTISAWVKWNGQPATAAYQGLLGKRTVYATNMMWQLEIANNAASLLTFKSNIDGITGPILPVGEWTQVVITYDGTTATMYRNGTYSVSGPMTLNDGFDANLMIGAVGLDPAQTGPTSPFNGTMDDVRIYNYALDPVTVAYSFTDITGGTACANPRNPTLVAFDLDGDCKIGLSDMVDWASHWLDGQLVPDVVSRP